MRKAVLLVVIVAFSGICAHGQVIGRRPFVRASGEGVVTIRPDQVKVNVGVQTQGNTAQEAADTNAAQMAVVMEKLRALLGANADLRTVSYSVSPVYRYPTGGGVATLVGYTATNMIEVTSGDLSMGGRIIDTATQAGANQVQGIRFTLKDPGPARAQALRQATMQAKSHAEAIAGGLGMRLGLVISAEETSAVRPVYADNRVTAAAGATPTPVESGTLEVHASVVVEAEAQQ